MTNEIWQGYGDLECHECMLIKHPGFLKLCQAMVNYTKLEVEAAEAGDMTMAALWEGMQNHTWQILECTPGFHRL